MAVAVGLDVGTTAVKAIAVSETGEVLASCEEEYPLSTPRPGWAEQDPEDWWRATERVLARLDAGDVAGIGLSGQMHGLVALDASDAVIRARDPVERRPHRRRVRGDRGAHRPRAARRADRQPRAARVHRPEAAVAAHARARALRAHRPRAAAQGLRAPAALTGERAQDVADASGTLLLRRRAPAVERRGARGARARPRLAAARARVARARRAHRRRRARGRRRGRPGGRRAGRRRRCAPARPRSPWEPRASSSPAWTPTRTTRSGACTRSATRSRASGRRWA